MNCGRAFVIALVGLLIAILLSSCRVPLTSESTYPGPRCHPDGSPVPALAYSNSPVPWRAL